MKLSHQLAQATPRDLNADTDEDEGGQADQRVDAGLAEISYQRRGKSICTIDRERNGEDTEQCRGDDEHRMSRDLATGMMTTDRQRNGDGTGSDGERQRQRIEAIVRRSQRIRLDLLRFRTAGVVEQPPAHGSDEGAPRHTYHRNSDAEELQNERTEQHRS